MFDLTVDAVNDAPVANDDAYPTNEDTPLTVTAPGVLANDTDVDTPPASLTAVLVAGPSNALSFTLNADGSFSYTPINNFSGADSFTYKANDGTSDSNVATVTITVNAVNDSPTIQNNTGLTVAEGSTNNTITSTMLLVNDVDNTAAQIVFTIGTAPVNGTLKKLGVAQAAGGTFTQDDINNNRITYDHDGTNTTSDSFTFTVSDGAGGTIGLTTFNITITAVNDAPSITAGGTLNYTENDPATVIDNTITVNDGDSTTLASATIQITGNYANGQDVLSFANTGTITGVFAAGSGTLTLTGTDTLTNYQTALRAVKYNNTSDNPSTSPRTVSWTVNDGLLNSNTATSTINITAVNDGPTIQNNTGITVAEGSTNNTITSARLSVSDVDNTATQIVFTIGTAPANGTLKKSGGALAAGGTFTQDDINNNRITYDHDGSNTTSDSFTFTVSDGAGGTIGLTTFNITITGVNDAPSITAGGTLSYTEGDAATVIDTTITITDGDSTTLASATVQINVNYVNGQDVLSFANTGTITGTFNAATGTLMLNGTDTLANYQLALRAVKYNNTSDNPSTSARTVTWLVNDGLLDSNIATSTINVTAVNDAPVNNVPAGTQSTNQNTPLIFSSGNGNQISVSDVDAGTSVIQVSLSVTSGTLTTNGTAGLNFACGGCSGDGSADGSMTFQGTIADINTALNGMNFTPAAGFSGAVTLTIVSNDLGNTGSGGAKSDTDNVSIQVATNISIQDAQVAEPASGSVNMIFTVTLSAPAPATGASVSFATQDLPGSCITCAVAGQDYTAQSGTLNFAVNEQFKTIAVPILSDNKKNEANEQFQVLLSNPVNAQIADGTAIGTILITNQPGALLISELRTSGPQGSGDDFVEIYNNSDSPHSVPAGPGYGLFKMGATCGDTPVLVGIIPGGTTIPARGHFLFTGPSYSLADYGGTGNATGDVPVADIENDRNVALFTTTSVGSLSSANRLDAVGFNPNVGGVCDLFREGNTLVPTAGSVLEYSYFRDECGKKGNPSLFGPCPTGGLTKDSNNNFDDFVFADTNASLIPAGQHLGAPGPQNMGSPRFNLSVLAVLLDSTKGAAANPNRVRDTSATGTNASQGTLSIRRRFVNNTGANVTQLRFRIVDISTTPVSGGVADLRALTSGPITVSVSDPATCTASGFPSSPCNVVVNGTTLETPPAQPLGGGNNSSMTTGVINLGSPLTPGASINLQFVLGVQSTGSFKFFFNIEALP
jgi:VCBS repeat-containing protein